MIELNPADAALTKVLPQQEPQRDVTYVPSQFVLAFTHGGKRYAFHTLTKQLLEVGLPEKTQWNSENEALIRGLFLVPEGKDECAYYNAVVSLIRLLERKKGNRNFMILPTLACNARCVYCYEEGMKPITMTPETADATVRHIVETHVGEPVRITWFGGEPLLRPDLIDRVCDGLQKAGVSFRCSVVSNGSLITDEIIQKMKGPWNMRSAQISVDGCESDYIARKRYNSYHDYYHSVMDVISRLSEAGISVIVRCNADDSIWDGVPQFLKDFAEGVRHRENVKLYFMPLDQIRSAENALPMWEKIVETRSRIEAAGLEPFLMPDLKRPFTIYHCMADSGSEVIGPDGKLYPCEHCLPETCFGDVFRGTTNEAARAAFCRAGATREMCRRCVFLPLCTNFSTCPIQDTDCAKVNEMMVTDTLRYYIDHQTTTHQTETAAEEISVC